jgi:hypothetical protein
VRAAAEANAIVTVPETKGESVAGLRRGEIVEIEALDWSNVFRYSCETRLAKDAAA